jgi:hypothetical protein
MVKMMTKIVKPSSSYSLELPEEVREKFEGSGEPLRERMAKEPGGWRLLPEKLSLGSALTRRLENAWMKLVRFGCTPTSFGLT